MNKLLKENIILIISLLILNIISIFNMLNAKLISNTYNNAFNKQLLWFIIGYILIIIIKKININKLFKYSKYLYVFNNIILLLTLFIGTNINGAKCWINIFGISFQPSELMKLSLILYLSYIINNTKLDSFKDKLLLILKIFIIVIIPSILVFLEPDTGAIINYLIIFLICLFSIKLNKKFYISFVITIILLLIILIYLMIFNRDLLLRIVGSSLFYRIDRLTSFINGNSYQLENALITIGSSSFFKFDINNIMLYIPEAPTDFIFAFTIGNYGLFSALLILLSISTIIMILIFKNNKIKNKQYKLFISSYLFIFTFQSFYNILMNIGLLPIMGIPLTFVSYGGTNTIINYIFLGIIINM